MTPQTREEWLALRAKSLGASEAAAVVGLCPSKTNVQLWEEKTGRRTPPDLSGLPQVQFGVAAEPLVRGLGALMLDPQFSVSYGGAFDVVTRAGAPWYMATLDGRLTDSSGAPGVLEIKTGTIYGYAQAEKWHGRVPDNYLCQILHQLNATGWRYATLLAFCREPDARTSQIATMRRYDFALDDYADQAAWLLDAEEKFWWHVTNDRRPDPILPPL